MFLPFGQLVILSIAIYSSQKQVITQSNINIPYNLCDLSASKAQYSSLASGEVRIFIYIDIV